MNHSQTYKPGRASPGFAKAQRGMATLLIILLVGVALVSISLGVMYSIRSSQERQIASHAQVNAQAGAWAAAEAMREYIKTLDAAALAGLLNQKLTLSGYGGVAPTAEVTGINGPITVDGKTAYRVNVKIESVATAARASSVLELVYQTFPATGGVTTPNTSVINYHGDLNLTGGIDILKDAGDTSPYEINVIGNVTIGGTAITGLDVIRSTASVSISGASSFIRAVYANGDVSVSSATLPQTIQATRHICLNNANRAAYPAGESRDSVDMRANGSIILSDEGGGHNNVFALAGRGGYSYIAEATTTTTAATALCNNPVSDAFGAYGSGAVNPTADSTAGGVKLAQWGARASVVRSGIDILIQGTSVVGELHAERDIRFLNNGDTLERFARYGGQLYAADYVYNNLNLFGPNNSTGKDQKQQNYNFALEPARRVDLQTETFDVNDLKDGANYIFSIDASGHKRVVVRQVRNSGGVALDYEGADLKGYYLLTMDWLCTTPTAAIPNAAHGEPDPSVCPIRIGRGSGNGNNTTLISYNNGKWDLSGDKRASLATGVAFFEGNLNVGVGSFFNTFLATGDITTSGATMAFAPNYAGYNGTQTGTVYAGVYRDPGHPEQGFELSQGICVNSLVPNLIPQQFCGADFDYNVRIMDTKIGNYAFMAGTCAGVVDCTKNNYQGGNVITGALANIHGTVKAGNVFKSGGNSTVHGFVAALGQGQTSGHQMGAKTTVDLRNLPTGYDPTGGPSTPGTVIPGTLAEVGILWSRYL